MISLRFFRKNKVILVHIFLTFELTFPRCFLQYFQPALRRQTGHNRLIFDTNHGLFSDCFQEKKRGLFLSEKGRLAKCLTRQILNKKVCTSAHCRSALQSGQMQTQNQMKGVFTMQINITARDFGGTEFLAQPHRLHLGAQMQPVGLGEAGCVGVGRRSLLRPVPAARPACRPRAGCGG